MTATATRARLFLATLLLVLAAGVALPGAAQAVPAAAPVPAIAPAMPAVDLPCDKVPAWARGACGVAGGAAGVILPILGGGAAVAGTNTVKLASKAGGIMSKLNPANIPEEWAKAAAQGAGSLLASIQSSLLGSAPNLMNGDYLVMYEVCWGIGVVVAAFAMTFAAAQATSSRAEAVALKKEAAARGLGFMPVMIVMPLVLTALWGISFELARWFGTDSQSKAQPLLESWFAVTLPMGSFSSFPGMGIGALMFFGLTAVAAFFAWLEAGIAIWGGYVIPLFVPVLFALSINPRWKRPLGLLASGLGAVMLTPVLIFFGFWVMWGVAHMSMQPGGATGLTPITLVLIGVMAAAMVPVTVPFLLASLTGGGGHGLGGMSFSSRRGVGTATRATQAGIRTARSASFTGRRGGWGSSRPVARRADPSRPGRGGPDSGAGQTQASASRPAQGRGRTGRPGAAPTSATAGAAPKGGTQTPSTGGPGGRGEDGPRPSRPGSAAGSSSPASSRGVGGAGSRESAPPRRPSSGGDAGGGRGGKPASPRREP